MLNITTFEELLSKKDSLSLEEMKTIAKKLGLNCDYCSTKSCIVSEINNYLNPPEPDYSFGPGM
ncbi:hypothetical protein CPG37_02765 [Malaciobacter canalis]|uniref:SAP domain-containing protein n=1 Tax=Malaciobacter canalis TaxID=1912871 RepID=A0ABX4LSN7_9BACT|nr:hypothetical protein [Malaciobacter canalis]PHO10783.1 hypothetical protein CPG37_02765 [Malaciobacter canalis]QEE33940.1 hypothetical protein ACAN_2502 [Malaciobacter canalis]